MTAPRQLKRGKIAAFPKNKRNLRNKLSPVAVIFRLAKDSAPVAAVPQFEIFKITGFGEKNELVAHFMNTEIQ